MAYLKYQDSNINFIRVSQPAFTTSGRISHTRFRADENNNIINRQGKTLNAIDIDWNGAYLESLGVYIDTTGQLLSQIDSIYSTLQQLSQTPTDLTPIQNSIDEINELLSTKANANDIPIFVSDLSDYLDYATVSYVDGKFRTYAKTPYDVYYNLEEQAGRTPMSQSAWLNSLKGSNGVDGLSAYEIALQYRYYDNEIAWLNSLKGEKGDKGDKGDMGPALNILGYYTTLSELQAATISDINGIGDAYNVGGVIYVYNNLYNELTDTIDNKWKSVGQFKGDKGDDGKSAYDIYCEIEEALGNTPLSKSDWLNSLKGSDGEHGIQGKSAYEVYCDIEEALGHTPLSAADWVESLKGESISYTAGNGISIESNTISINSQTAWGIINN